MIRGVHHTAISTGDLDRSLAFYRDMLGFEEVTSFAWETGEKEIDGLTGLRDSAARVALLRTGNAFLELFQYASPTPRAGDPDRPVCDHGITHVCLEVKGIDDEFRRLSDAGMRFHSEPISAGVGVRAAYGRDPDGNVVELLEVTDANSAFALPRATSQ